MEKEKIDKRVRMYCNWEKILAPEKIQNFVKKIVEEKLNKKEFDKWYEEYIYDGIVRERHCGKRIYCFCNWLVDKYLLICGQCGSYHEVNEYPAKLFEWVDSDKEEIEEFLERSRKQLVV